MVQKQQLESNGVTTEKNPPSPKSRLAMLKRTKKATTASDPFRFQNNGVTYKGKLIGEKDVDGARGDAMCAEAMRTAKAMIKAAGAHKVRITLQINIDGIKILDEKTNVVLHNFPVSRISFIARDTTDSRAFGLIFGEAGGNYKFYGIKTAQAADQAVLAIRDMFQVVFEMKKKQIEQVKQQQASGIESPESKEGGVAVADLLDLESELQQIQQGVQQLSTVHTDAFGASPFGDPFADSFGSSTFNNSSIMNGSTFSNSSIASQPQQSYQAFSTPQQNGFAQPLPWNQQQVLPPMPQHNNSFESTWGATPQAHQLHHVQSTPAFHTNTFSETNPFASAVITPQTAAPLLMADPFHVRSVPPRAGAPNVTDWGTNENTAPAQNNGALHHANTFANFDNKTAQPKFEERKVTSLEEAFSKLVDMDSLVGRSNEIKKNPFEHILNPPKASLNTLSATSCSAAATKPVVSATSDPFGDDFFR